MTSILAENQSESSDQSELKSLVEDTSILVSPPDIYLKINEMLAENCASADEFATVIAHDPGLTARLLKLVNSAYYGLPSKIDTISRALTVVGMHELTNLVYSICAIKTFSKVSSDVTNMNTFWRHGIYTGIAAREIAMQTNCLHPERLFVAGLLHDIGSLAINRKYPEVAEQTISASEGNEQYLVQLEKEQLGFNHAELGALMFESWHLPEATCRAIQFHHAPDTAGDSIHEAGIVHISDALANVSGTGSFSEKVAEATDMDSEILAPLGIDADFDYDQLLGVVDQKFIETVYLLVA